MYYVKKSCPLRRWLKSIGSSQLPQLVRKIPLPTRSLYQAVFPIPGPVELSVLWEIKLPLKIRIFLWQWVRGRLPSGTEVRKRNGPGDGLWPIFLVPEDCNHIFFQCPVAQFLWSCLREVVGGNWCHDNLPDLFGEVLRLPGASRPPTWVALGTLTWTL